MPSLARRLPAPAFLILLLALAVPVRLLAQQPRPHGAWRLDATHADSTAGTIKGGEGGMGPPPGERPGDPSFGPPGVSGAGGGGRRYGGGGRYGRGASDKDMERMRQTFELARRPAARVVIDADSSHFTRFEADGSEQVYPIGGKALVEPAQGEAEVKTRVHWKGDALLVERKVDGGGKVTESYGLGLDGTRMIVFVQVELGMMQRSYTRRYLPD